jgi:hypothetical protein
MQQNDQSMDFTVRIRFRLPSADRMGGNESEMTLSSTESLNITLKAANGPPTTICQSEWLILEGSGWSSEISAREAAGRLTDALRRSLARHHMGADLGELSTPQCFFFDSYVNSLEIAAGRRTLADVHGAMVFPTEPRPLFARLNPPRMYRTLSEEGWRESFLAALDFRYPLTSRERTAFDLYSIAHAVAATVHARFAILFTAIESMIEPAPRPDAVVEHVNALIDITRNVNLPNDERRDLLGSLAWLRGHSIRRNGRRFVRDRLADRRYNETNADGFFDDCYTLRSRLVHGVQPFPTREEVSTLVGELDRMVGDLLAGALTEPTIV